MSSDVTYSLVLVGGLGVGLYLLYKASNKPLVGNADCVDKTTMAWDCGGKWEGEQPPPDTNFSYNPMMQYYSDFVNKLAKAEGAEWAPQLDQFGCYDRIYSGNIGEQLVITKVCGDAIACNTENKYGIIPTGANCGVVQPDGKSLVVIPPANIANAALSVQQQWQDGTIVYYSDGSTAAFGTTVEFSDLSTEYKPKTKDALNMIMPFNTGVKAPGDYPGTWEGVCRNADPNSGGLATNDVGTFGACRGVDFSVGTWNALDDCQKAQLLATWRLPWGANSEHVYPVWTSDTTSTDPWAYTGGLKPCPANATAPLWPVDYKPPVPFGQGAWKNPGTCSKTYNGGKSLTWTDFETRQTSVPPTSAYPGGEGARSTDLWNLNMKFVGTGTCVSFS